MYGHVSVCASACVYVGVGEFSSTCVGSQMCGDHVGVMSGVFLCCFSFCLFGQDLSLNLLLQDPASLASQPIVPGSPAATS